MTVPPKKSKYTYGKIFGKIHRLSHPGQSILCLSLFIWSGQGVAWVFVLWCVLSWGFGVYVLGL